MVCGAENLSRIKLLAEIGDSYAGHKKFKVKSLKLRKDFILPPGKFYKKFLIKL
jgi:hypothetical protein